MLKNNPKAIKINIEDFIAKKQLKTAASQFLKKPIQSGTLQARFSLVCNDHTRPSFRKLVEFKCIIGRQLPKMPKTYITKLLFDGKHESLMAESDEGEIMGGVCFRCFDHQDFAEVVFLAVEMRFRDRRVGSQIMDSLKCKTKTI
jgi:histone acetyltransferase